MARRPAVTVWRKRRFLPPRPRPADVQPSGDAARDVEAEIERIDEIISNARTTWFALLASLVFAGITLASVRDVAFFVTSERTQLPLVDISVPVTSFFTAGSLLIAAFYTYFHVYLERLWQVLGTQPPRVGGKPLAHRLHPWVVVDAALRWRDRLRKASGDERCSTPHRMAAIGDVAAIVLVWLFGLQIVAWFWWRSMPAHDPTMTGWIAIVLIATLGVFLRSATAAHAYLADRKPGWRWWFVFGPAVFTIAGLTVVRTWIDPWEGLPRESFITWPICERYGASTSGMSRMTFCIDEFSITKDLLRPARADLREVVFTEKPKDWLGKEIAESEFRVRWCREKRGLECQNPLSVDDGRLTEKEESAFQRDWKQRWTAILASMPKPDLRKKDLRGADLSLARLEGADLQDVRLEGADLSGASLDSANFSGTKLEGAEFFGASLRGAELAGERLRGVSFVFASLGGANLSGAELIDADFTLAGLENADLSSADLEGAGLLGASFDGTNLSGARIFGKEDAPLDLGRMSLSGSRWSNAGLRNATMSGVNIAEIMQFETSFGDGSVILPAGIPRPCQWANERLGDADFFGRWRGWLEVGNGYTGDVDAYDPIPPPPGCGPVVREEPGGESPASSE